VASEDCGIQLADTTVANSQPLTAAFACIDIQNVSSNFCMKDLNVDVDSRSVIGKLSASQALDLPQPVVFVFVTARWLRC